ncbi:MAG: hypothetical protein RLZZ444_85 [Pseudomonadota bacterium]
MMNQYPSAQNKPVSLWMEQMGSDLPSRPAIERDMEVDVAIIGAGYTGLWAAYYLKRKAPHLRIALFEARHLGFGASGRNGGWLMGHMLGEFAFLSALPESERLAFHRLVSSIPDEAGDVFAREGIDCGFRKGGMLTCAARYPEQADRLAAELEFYRSRGLTDEDNRFLTPAEIARHVRIHNVEGAIYSPHCATIHPAKLVFGLAETLERMQVEIYENSPVSDWKSGELTARDHRVRAKWVVPCVEGHAAELAPLGRYQLAVQSLQVATEPLAPAIWDEIGMAEGEAVHEMSRVVTYFHRTRDDRLVFGARGSYRFGGKLRQDFTLSPQEIDYRRRLITELFPQLAGVKITHGWGGNLGMTRRFRPFMLADRRSGIASAGGYGGEGVGASNLAGRTLADLILGEDSLLTRAPWAIRDKSLDEALKVWEPEPFRWLGYSAVVNAFTWEDRVLANPKSPAPYRKFAIAVADGVSRAVAPELLIG